MSMITTLSIAKYAMPKVSTLQGKVCRINVWYSHVLFLHHAGYIWQAGGEVVK